MIVRRLRVSDRRRRSARSGRECARSGRECARSNARVDLFTAGLTDIKMIRHTIWLTLVAQLTVISSVSSAKQQVQLSDSYLPVAMQIIAHLTDQMAFETRDDITPSPPTTPPTTRPTTRPTSTTTRPTSTTTRPTSTTTRPTSFSWTTNRPYVTSSPYPGAFQSTNNGWWMGFTTTRRSDMTTPFHRPGLYAPFLPPKTFFNRYQTRNFLLPIYLDEQTVLGPQETRSEEPLLAIHEEEVGPLMEPSPDVAPLLPPHFDVKISSRSDGFLLEDVDDESLQHLSDDVRDMIKMAKDPHDERVLDIWERSGAQPEAASKAKLSGSNLRLLLLYDLLSRDAKKQRLSDYSGFSPDVMKVLVESSSGGARMQLRTALSKMVERHDCGHDYANNRAKEMVDELGKDESKLSSELRYLQPLVYKY